jgi:GT2 family glycosyltransferase
VRELGGFREEYDGAHEYDLTFRIVARTLGSTGRIEHIPDILYHRRKLPSGATDSRGQEACRRALQSYLDRIGRPGSVAPGPAPSVHRVRFALRELPRVSIIIPTAYGQGILGGRHVTLLSQCLASIFKKSSYRNYEIVVVDNDAPPSQVLKEMRLRGIRYAPYAVPFNWSAAMNQGAALATGDHLVFLNDDTEVISSDWLEALLEYSQQPEVGAVGARLLFPDGRIQHAGITILAGRPVHPFYGQPGDHTGYFHSNIVPRTCSAVTGACLMTRAAVFRSVGGFTESLDLNFNDIDYCLKIAAQGRRAVYTPYAELFHHEAVTKPGLFPRELDAFRERWRGKWPRDPYYNPNLSTRFPDYRIDEAC